MPGFSSEEVQASINRFLTTQIESTKTRLGLRDTLAMRNAAYDILTTSLLLRPDSYFYLVWLTTNRLRALITANQADIASIDEQAQNLAFRTKPIASTTELTNARAAVLELNAGLSSRRGNQGIAGSIGPAVDRFRRSTERFIRSELTKNVVRSGTVVETPEEIRANLRTLLANVLERHEQILPLATAITEAISRFGQVQLPQRAVADIVTRISEGLASVQATLEGDTALQQSRESMLELLTMRTILTRASSFREPRQLLVPLPTDEQTLNLEAGTIPGSKTGTVSAPFNYDRAVTNQLRVQVNTPLTQIDTTLPAQGSNAFVRSGILSFPFTPTVGSAIDVLVDGGGPLTMSPSGGPYVSPAALATHLDGLVAGLSVVADGNRMVFFSDTFDDESSVEFDATVGGADVFLGDIPLETLYSGARPVEMEAILEEIANNTIGFRAEEVVTDFGSFVGTLNLAGDTITAEPSVSGVDLVVTTGSPVVSSPSVNLEQLGVRPGMAIDIGAPVNTEALVVTVEDNVLVLDQDMPASGPASYLVGPDFRSVPVGARVRVSCFDEFRNSVFRRVSSSGVATITLDAAVPVTGTAFEVDGNIETRFLKINAVGVGESDGITANPADPGLVALGFTATATQAKAAATSVVPASGNVDFIQRGVRVGDALDMSQGATSFSTQTVTGVEAQRLRFSPGIEFQPTNDFSYRVTSARYNAWATLQSDIQSGWLDVESFSDTEDLEFQVSRLIRGANPSQQIQLAIDTYEAGLATLLAAIDDYVVPLERTIDNILRMLNEQGMDRALDLLTTLEIVEFFTMSPDSVSYSTHLIRTAAVVTREVAPVGKSYKSLQPGVNPQGRIERPDAFDPNAPTDIDQ